ncbi:hypothetical protein [Sphingomonas bacterium]|uniref:hypothetical protein n=1 Tax=Sphingomonas bacterium TaxID=1895847 RepID=UPI0015758329|nr:hypothetical protein [Sphingomonas bacterium]
MATVQAHLDQVTRTNGRIEACQREILRRLDAVEAGQVSLATLTAHTHAALLGNGTALPVDLADDPLLEKYLLGQPADRTSTSRALVEWRRAAIAASAAELANILEHQYDPSPTDTAEARLLRYQLAAITREELRGRGVTPPSPPTSTRAEDRSPEMIARRSAELARLWRAGESTGLFGDPELGGAIDLFEAAERRGHGVPEGQLAAELRDLHRALGDRLAAGERPSAAEELVVRHGSHQLEVSPEQTR